MNTTTEIWRDIPGCQSLYQVSNFGRVKSFKGGEHFLKPTRRGKGYKAVTVQRNGEFVNEYVHRLVAEIFVTNPDGKPEVNHINGIRNDNRAVNLEWTTAKENNRHRVSCQLAGRRFTAAQIAFICDNPKRISDERLAQLFNVPKPLIWRIRKIGVEVGNSRGRGRQPGMTSLF